MSNVNALPAKAALKISDRYVEVPYTAVRRLDTNDDGEISQDEWEPVRACLAPNVRSAEESHALARLRQQDIDWRARAEPARSWSEQSISCVGDIFTADASASDRLLGFICALFMLPLALLALPIDALFGTPRSRFRADTLKLMSVRDGHAQASRLAYDSLPSDAIAAAKTVKPVPPASTQPALASPK